MPFVRIRPIRNGRYSCMFEPWTHKAGAPELQIVGIGDSPRGAWLMMHRALSHKSPRLVETIWLMDGGMGGCAAFKAAQLKHG